MKQVVFPDPQIGWYPAAVAGGTRLLRQGPFDLIFFGRIDMTFSGGIDALRLLTKLKSICLETSAFEESCP